MSQPAPQTELQYVARPEVTETFADLLEKIVVDGQTSTLRMEFCVVRMDDPKPNQTKQTGKKYTACRVILPMVGFFDMLNKFQQLASAMEQQGLLKREQVQPILTPQGSGKPN
jgi:hypothetical protein